jgi:hypothetical protein
LCKEKDKEKDKNREKEKQKDGLLLICWNPKSSQGKGNISKHSPLESEALSRN